MSKLPLLIIIVIIIIVLIAFTYQKHIFPSIIPSNTLKSNLTTSSSTTTIQPILTTTTIPLNTSVFISEINIKRLYLGPEISNNQSCNYFNITMPYNYNELMKGGTDFNFTLTLDSTSYCPITIKNISATTSNFKISETNPILPYTLPGHNSQVSIQVNVTTPFSNFSGPLSITIYET